MADNEQNDFTIRTLEGDLEGKAKEIVPESATVDQLPAGVFSEEKTPRKRALLWVGGGVLLLAGLGLLGYFVLSPLLFPSPAVAPAVSEEEPATPVVERHQSLFVKSPLAIARINLPDLSLLNIAVAFQNEAAQPLADKSVKEVEILDSQGNQIPFGNYLARFLPALPAAKLAEWFVNDFTAYLYYDENGVWPGYVAKVKPGVNVPALKLTLAKIESADITVFYVSPAGVMSKFKDGQVNNFVTRYSVGSQPGASFNYFFGDNYFIISTAYSGLKAALPLLGL